MSITEESWTSWLCDLEHINLVNESDSKGVDGSFVAAPQEENLQRSFSSSNMSNSSEDDKIFGEIAEETPKNDTSNAEYTYLSQNKDSSPSYIIFFDNANPAPISNNHSTSKPKGKPGYRGRKGSLENQNKEPTHNLQENNNSGSLFRSPRRAKDHIIAERKRREKISQQFIALSALIPGLKKTDKASVLGDAIKHVKQLQEQVKLLDEQNKRKRVESVVYVEKSMPSAEEHVSVSDTSPNYGDGNSYVLSKTNGSLHEVEAMVSEKHVLIRIHCEKQKLVFTNILKEVENLHLSVINSSILLFGTSKLDITIVAEKDDEFSLSVKELASNLRVGLMQFM